MDEEQIIRTYFAPLAAGASGAFDLTDDAAALSPPPDTDLIITTDALVAGIHFLPDDPPTDVAAKALGVNLSDLAAKGADPLAYTLSISLPKPVSAEWLAGFREGLAAMQAAHGIQLLGGDTTRSPGALMISITAIGTTPAGEMIRRGSAKAGDLLYVSGTIGDAALGLQVATNDQCGDGWKLDEAARSFLLARYRRPQPRTDLARILRNHASAGLDISDGLVIDAGRLCRTSGVAATIRAEDVPLSSAARACLNADPHCLETLFTGGDDYEVLFTLSPECRDALEQAATAAKTAIHCIGEINTTSEVATGAVEVIRADGLPLQTAHPGYTHFA